MSFRINYSNSDDLSSDSDKQSKLVPSEKIISKYPASVAKAQITRTERTTELEKTVISTISNTNYGKRKKSVKTAEQTVADKSLGGSQLSSSTRTSVQSSFTYSLSESYTSISTLHQLETKITRIDLNSIRVPRYLLEKLVHLPFFNQVVIGCFVRVGIGNTFNGENVYRVAEVVGVCETNKIFNQLRQTRTDKILKLKHGKQEKEFRLQFVSNQNFSQSKFQFWIETCKESEIELSEKDKITAKQQDIQKAMRLKFNETSDLEVVKYKRTKISHPVAPGGEPSINSLSLSHDYDITTDLEAVKNSDELSTNDLFSIHDFDIKIDLDTPIQLPVNVVKTKSGGCPKRSTKLAEYMKRHGHI